MRCCLDSTGVTPATSQANLNSTVCTIFCKLRNLDAAHITDFQKFHTNLMDRVPMLHSPGHMLVNSYADESDLVIFAISDAHQVKGLWVAVVA